MVNVYLFPADEGDFIWVRYGNGERFSNIVIDGGTKDSAIEYAEVIEYIDRRHETIEALILTHIDYDHLQGAVEGIGRLSPELLKRTVKRVLFNTCRGILREQKASRADKGFAEDLLKGRIPTEGYGIDDAIQFMDLLEVKGIRQRLADYIAYGQVLQWGHGEVIRIISPGKEELRKFYNKWEPYCKDRQITSYSANIELVERGLDDLKPEKLGFDPSENNAASIAFIFEYEDVKIAFLADAKPAVCLRGLKECGVKGCYPVDLFKVSHHGSKSNTSDALLRKLQAKNYLLSTNGKGQKVPNKTVIAHLLKSAAGQELQLLCNYDWWDTVYYGKYFTKEDMEEYLDTGKLRLVLLDEEGIEAKGGLRIYGER